MELEWPIPSRSKLALGMSVLLAIIIAILTLTPISAPELTFVTRADALYHALAFAGLVLPIAVLRPGWLLAAIPVYAAFGGLIEIIQPFVGRECDLSDWIADMIGMTGGVIIGLSLGAAETFINNIVRRPRSQ